ncbi:hypothetical protein RINGS_6 [Arthrobacter phage Rings]|uniref:Uncharacterized protein n=1 Tax=Arthrobacter phage Rings TaxID=1772313 RepID=A0A0U4IXC7_9CAUD|nr:hypothetical protein RINGS_6 [Arthrobacter phage Rings]
MQSRPGLLLWWCCLMAKNKDKPIDVNERMKKRIREARYQQDRKAACLICRGPFSDCPHSWGTIDLVCSMLRVEDIMGGKKV